MPKDLFVQHGAVIEEVIALLGFVLQEVLFKCHCSGGSAWQAIRLNGALPGGADRFIPEFAGFCKLSATSPPARSWLLFLLARLLSLSTPLSATASRPDGALQLCAAAVEQQVFDGGVLHCHCFNEAMEERLPFAKGSIRYLGCPSIHGALIGSQLVAEPLCHVRLLHQASLNEVGPAFEVLLRRRVRLVDG